MTIRCRLCAASNWQRVATDVFATCAYEILRCLECGIAIAVKVPREERADG